METDPSPRGFESKGMSRQRAEDGHGKEISLRPCKPDVTVLVGKNLRQAGVQDHGHAGAEAAYDHGGDELVKRVGRGADDL